MTILTAVLLCVCAQEKMDNPQYTYWKSFKPGAWVKHKMVMETAGRTIVTEMVTTLTEVNPENVLIEVKTTIDMGIRKMEQPVQKKDVPARIDKKEGQGVLSEKDETIVIDEKSYKCRSYEWEQTQNGQAMKSKGYFCADVPGGTIKSEYTSANLPKPMVLTLVAFEKK